MGSQTPEDMETLLDEARGWSFFPPPTDAGYIQQQEGQEKFILESDQGVDINNSFSVNWIGLAIGFAILLFILQMSMPGIKQMGDFIGAVYSPYAGDTDRYDVYYDDYDRSGGKYSQQYRNFEEDKNLLSNIVNGDMTQPAQAGLENLQSLGELSAPAAATTGLLN